jgi:hypothetical protein
MFSFSAGSPTSTSKARGDASVAKSGEVSSRITDLQPASQNVKQAWFEIANTLREGNSRLDDRA